MEKKAWAEEKIALTNRAEKTEATLEEAFIGLIDRQKMKNEKSKDEIKKENKCIKGKIKVLIKYLVALLCTSVILYFIGDNLGNVLESLKVAFNIPEAIIGIALGFITSLPELITFFESQKHYKKEDAKEGIVEATNNLLTSNMLNLFIIQTIGIIIINLV